MTEHTIRSYDQELTELDNKISEMGGLAEHLLQDSFDALEKRDPVLADRVVSNDRRIDQLKRDIQDRAIAMIARWQPTANDLRLIMAATQITNDLERIGDLAKNIANRAHTISAVSHPAAVMTGLRTMGRLALQQLRDVLDAYTARDAEKALKVWKGDAEIDAAYNSLFRELLTYMMEDHRNIGLSTHLLFGAKNIERVGDHATNIAETVHFLVRGTNILDDRPKGDTTSLALPGNA
jgi:phosphate transport system protein